MSGRQVLVDAEALEKVLKAHKETRIDIVTDGLMCGNEHEVCSSCFEVMPGMHAKNCPVPDLRAALTQPKPSSAGEVLTREEVEGIEAGLNGCVGTHNPYIFGPQGQRDAWERGNARVREISERGYEQGKRAAELFAAQPRQPAPGGEASRWIPVEERLPEFGTQVIVWDVGYLPDDIPAWRLGRLEIYEEGEQGNRILMWVDDAGDLLNATHWQNSPTAPAPQPK